MNKNKLAFILSLLVIQQIAAVSKIVGGQETTSLQHPWQVSLQRSFTGHFCGGNLIAKNMILTAAHCVDDYKAREIRVKGGSIDGSLKKLKRIARVKEIILHPNYSKGILAPHDIAILILRQEVTLSKNVQLIILPQNTEGLQKLEDSFTNMTGSLVSSGWGATAPPNPMVSLSDTLNEVSLLPIGVTNTDGKDDLFKKLLVDKYYFDYDMADYVHDSGSKVLLTAGVNEKTGVCIGDSGGPLVYHKSNSEPVLIGISSYTAGGIKLCHGISGFTNVQAYANWINKYLK